MRNPDVHSSHIKRLEFQRLIKEYDSFRRTGQTEWVPQDEELKAYWLFQRWFILRSYGRNKEVKTLNEEILSYPDQHILRAIHRLAIDDVTSEETSRFRKLAINQGYPQLWLQVFLWFDGGFDLMRLDDEVALEKYLEMLKISQELGFQYAVGQSLWCVSNCYFRLGLMSNMIEALEQLSVIAKQNEYPPLLAEAYLGKAQYLYFVGDLKKARRFANLALDQCHTEPHSFRVDRILFLRAQIELAAGRLKAFHEAMEGISENCRLSKRTEDDMTTHLMFRNKLYFFLTTHNLEQFSIEVQKFPKPCLDIECEFNVKVFRLLAEVLNPDKKQQFISNEEIDLLLPLIDKLKEIHIEAPIWHFALLLKKNSLTEAEDQLKKFRTRSDFRRFPHVGVQLRFFDFCRAIQRGENFEPALLELIRFCRTFSFEFEQAKYLWYWKILFENGVVGPLSVPERRTQKLLLSKYSKELNQMTLVWPFSALLNGDNKVSYENPFSSLTGKLQSLGDLLFERKEHVATLQELSVRIWGEPFESNRHSGRIQVLVQRLRLYLRREYGNKYSIETLKGTGYRLIKGVKTISRDQRKVLVEEWIKKQPKDRPLTSIDLMRTFHYSERQAQRTMNRLVDSCLLHAEGTKRNRRYRIA